MKIEQIQQQARELAKIIHNSTYIDIEETIAEAVEKMKCCHISRAEMLRYTQSAYYEMYVDCED